MTDDIKNTDITDDLNVEKLRAEIAKLKTERDKLDEERGDALWNRRFGRYVSLAMPGITVALTLLGIYIGAWEFKNNLSTTQNNNTQQLALNKDLKKQELEYDRQMKQQERMHDFLKSFEASQSATYFALCQAAGTINALHEGDQGYSQAKLRFIQLSQGDARIVGDESVIKTMGRFSSCMMGLGVCSGSTQSTEMQRRARDLADACRESMARTSEVDVDKAEDFEKLLRSHERDKIVLPDN